ncbi:MAG: hypothetical protein GWO38_33260 [Phycisphaerae bacterium]|nr:hypothetical protein [Phycisphaerae bacterium]NIP56033.1 hypothetical protein [Phycisphaerae bacterium]NIX32363.1 hypothetical protein [Phycisphaerae bacterium]
MNLKMFTKALLSLWVRIALKTANVQACYALVTFPDEWERTFEALFSKAKRRLHYPSVYFSFHPAPFETVGKNGRL